ncbi:MAG: rod shape-determining protein MreD [Porphyromonadaceae bacterium]|nr:rod shape-determining protein MreD [Porphyromonadaceae bacterium]
MNSTWFRFILTSLLVIVLQVWVLNPIALYRVATPYIYPVLLLFLPIRLKPTALTLIGFTLGTIIDLLGVTPGLHASALTFVGFLRYYLVKPMLDKNMPDYLLPLYDTLKGGSILLLVELMTLHHVVLYLLDAGQYFDPTFFLIRLGSGWLYSMALALIVLFIFSIRLQPRPGHGQ